MMYYLTYFSNHFLLVDTAGTVRGTQSRGDTGEKAPAGYNPRPARCTCDSRGGGGGLNHDTTSAHMCFKKWRRLEICSSTYTEASVPCPPWRWTVRLPRWTLGVESNNQCYMFAKSKPGSRQTYLNFCWNRTSFRMEHSVRKYII